MILATILAARRNYHESVITALSKAVAPHPDVVVRGNRQVPMTVKQDPATGGFIEVPRDEQAYDYIVNGKSAIEWLVERYAVTIDKKSLIKNDANDWAREHHKPRYILDLVLSVINVSVQTVDIVNSLPRLAF